MKYLVREMRSRGFTVTLERWDQFDTFAGIRSAFCQARLTITNILVRALSLRLGSSLRSFGSVQSTKDLVVPTDKKIKKVSMDDSPSEEDTKSTRLQPTVLMSSNTPANMASGVSNPGASSTAPISRAAGTMASQGTSRASTQTSSQTRPPTQAAPAFTVASGNPSSVPMPNDFILLCLQVGRYEVRRHDISTLNLTQDRDLRKAFLEAYAANFTWLH